MKNASFILFLILISRISYSQIPSDNPYTTRFKISQHWTNQLKWGNVTDVSKIQGLIDQNRHVNLTCLEEIMINLSTKGGGVLYFPEGDYYFDENLVLYTGVIVRGATPKHMKDAKDPEYRPATRFIFPQFTPVFSGPAPESSAFKEIRCDNAKTKNIGVVNIDINRVAINFTNYFRDNIIVFGVRSNNAVTLENLKWVDEVKDAWQIYPKPDDANIMLKAKQYAVVSNCRLNDSITDDFNMPNYSTNDGEIFTKDTVRFQYGLHQGIKFQESTPDTPHFEISDNYVRSGVKKKIDCGSNVVQTNNQLKDMEVQNLIEPNGGYSIEKQKRVADSFKDSVYIKNKDSLFYYLLKPQNYNPRKKYRLFVFYPGKSDTGRVALVHFVNIFVDKPDQPYFVLVPKPIKTKSNILKAHYNMMATVEFANKIKKQYRIEKKDMYVAGLSSGGSMVWETILTYPKLFNTAILMSSIRPLSSVDLQTLKNISFIMSVSKDDPYVPLVAVQLIKSQMEQQGTSVSSYEYNNTGHFSWISLSNDKEFLKRLFN